MASQLTQPILTIQRQDDASAHIVVPNMLPCKVKHTGSVDALKSHWNPETSQDGSKTSYFRGRKMVGKTVKLPEDYRGFLVQKATALASAPEREMKNETRPIDIDAEDVRQQWPQEQTGALKVTGEFDEVVVWGQGTVGNATADPYMRGIEEWLVLSTKIHTYEES